MLRIAVRLKISFLIFAFVFVAGVICAEANIVIRAAVVNTSETQARKIPFKSYLPKEIKPENVVDMGELEIGYDPKENTYYVFKEFELGPRESRIIEIELEDVWKIPQDELASLREEADKVAKILAKTDYYERANYLKHSILSKLDEIEHTQNIINPNPGGYISDYRENMRRLESVKGDLQAAKTLMAEAKSLSPGLTWKLILAVVGFLGLLGLAFFIVWQKQIKNLPELTETYDIPEEPPVPSSASAEEGERRQATEEKKSEISDIEQRLKQKNP